MPVPKQKILGTMGKCAQRRRKWRVPTSLRLLRGFLRSFRCLVWWWGRGRNILGVNIGFHDSERPSSSSPLKQASTAGHVASCSPHDKHSGGCHEHEHYDGVGPTPKQESEAIPVPSDEPKPT